MAKQGFSVSIRATQAELDSGKFDAVSGERIEIIDSNGQKTGIVYESGASGSTPNQVVDAGNINTVLAAAGGAGWEKAQATAPNYAITKPTSGAGLDLHIEFGGSLAALNSTVWPVPATGVDQLRIRNMSAVAQTFSATGFSGIVTADGNQATSGSYSIPVDMAVHITIDEDGWIQVSPMGQEVGQAEFDAALALKANLASPALTGTPTVPTATLGTNTTQAASTAFVQAEIAADLATVAPPMDGTAAVGTSTSMSRQDHVHPSDTIKAPTASPTFTGVPAAPTPAVDTNTTQLATTAFVNAQLSGTLPLVNGTATVGSGNRSARGNHVHPTDTSRQATLVSGTTIKTINGVALPGSGDIAITPTTVSSTVPTHNLDLVSDNYAGRALHLRPNGMTATTNLATWSDSSGNGRDATQVTAGNQPDVVENVLNGLPIIDFDGTDDYMDTSVSLNLNVSTIFAVIRPTASSANKTILGATVPGPEWKIGPSLVPSIDLSGVGVLVNGTTPLVAGQWSLLVFKKTGVINTNGIYINGTADIMAANAAYAFGAYTPRITATHVVNSGTCFDGDIAEMIVFPTALSTTERQKVEGYLAHKYALLTNLDAGHPYKTTAPKVGDLQTHADNNAATTAGLNIGQVYMTSTGQLMVRY